MANWNLAQFGDDSASLAGEPAPAPGQIQQVRPPVGPEELRKNTAANAMKRAVAPVEFARALHPALPDVEARVAEAQKLGVPDEKIEQDAVADAKESLMGSYRKRLEALQKQYPGDLEKAKTAEQSKLKMAMIFQLIDGIATAQGHGDRNAFQQRISQFQKLTHDQTVGEVERSHAKQTGDIMDLANLESKDAALRARADAAKAAKAPEPGVYEKEALKKQAADDVTEIGDITENRKKSSELRAQLKQAMDLHKNLALSGPIAGRLTPELSDAAQTLKSLANSIKVRAVPPGQGAVSNFERELIGSGIPGSEMDSGPAQARYQQLLDMLDQAEKLDFERYRAATARQRGVGIRGQPEFPAPSGNTPRAPAGNIPGGIDPNRAAELGKKYGF